MAALGFARYPALSFAVIQEGLIRELAARRVGWNGWAVMAALCRRVYEDGGLGRTSANELSRATGLTANQVSRGMQELRDKGVIVPVMRRNDDGYLHPDRPKYGHVARYCISRDVWVSVAREADGGGGDVDGVSVV